MKKWLFVALCLCLAPTLPGCGGAGSNFSGPNPNSQAGTGTLIVTVQNAAGANVSDGEAIVSLNKGVVLVKSGKAKFYNLAPGKYFVEARSQSIGLPGEGRNIEIKADKTLSLTLSI